MRVRIAILLLHAFLVQLAINVAKPTLAYRALEANIPVEYIGLLAGSFSILPVLLALPIGRIADSRPTRGLVVAGALAMVVAGVGLLIASDSLFVLIIWSVLIGLGHLIGVLAGQLLIGRLAPKDLDSWFGYYTLTAAAGQGCGPLLVSAAALHSGLPDTQLLFAIFAAIAVFMIFAAIGATPPAHELRARDGAQPAETARFSLADLRLPEGRARPVFTAIAISVVSLVAFDLMSVYLPVLGVERGIPASVIGALLALRAFSTMASRVAIGPLIRRFDRERLMVVSTAIGALGIASLIVPMPLVVVAICLTVAGFALGFAQPLSMAQITLLAPADRLGLWLAIRLGLNRLAQTILPAIMGIGAAVLGTGGVFAGSTAILVAAAGFAAVGRRS